MNNEGPSPWNEVWQSCSGCKYHNQTMFRGGMDPEYHHFCTHPDAPKPAVGTPERHGIFIGRNHRTPQWCPFVKRTQARKEYQ